MSVLLGVKYCMHYVMVCIIRGYVMVCIISNGVHY